MLQCNFHFEANVQSNRHIVKWSSDKVRVSRYKELIAARMNDMVKIVDNVESSVDFNIDQAITDLTDIVYKYAVHLNISVI